MMIRRIFLLICLLLLARVACTEAASSREGAAFLRFSSVACGNGLFLGTDRDGIKMSADGETWTTTAEGAFFDLRQEAGGFIVRQWEEPYGVWDYQSLDGMTWTPRVLGVDNVITSGDMLIGWNKYNWPTEVYGSRDGESWLPLATLDGEYDLRMIGGRCFAASRPWSNGAGRHHVLTSTDCVEWTEASDTVYFSSYAGEKFFELKSANISDDGLSWLPAIFPFVPNAVAYGNGIYLIVGPNGKTATSFDGLSWQEQRSGATGDLTSVCYGNGRFLASGGAGIFLSTTGETWTPVLAH